MRRLIFSLSLLLFSACSSAASCTSSCESSHSTTRNMDAQALPEPTSTPIGAHPDASRRRLDPERTHVVILGSGTLIPHPDRAGPAVAVVVDGRAYLVDFGANVVRRATGATLATGLAALSPTNIRHAFCTHLHSDHTVGYPDLILTPWVVGRTEPLRVWGPPGIEAMTEHVLAAYGADRRVRSESLDHLEAGGPKVDVSPIDESGVVHRDDRVEVQAFAVDHGSFEHAYGYRFETDDRVVVISGDTRPTDSVAEACDGCDVLVHEVYSPEGFGKHSAAQRKYHASFHTSVAELGAVAEKARPKLLVLYHQLAWDTPPDAILRAIGERFSGRVEWADDNDVF